MSSDGREPYLLRQNMMTCAIRSSSWSSAFHSSSRSTIVPLKYINRRWNPQRRTRAGGTRGANSVGVVSQRVQTDVGKRTDNGGVGSIKLVIRRCDVECERTGRKKRRLGE